MGNGDAARIFSGLFFASPTRVLWVFSWFSFFKGGGMSMYVQNTTAEGLILGDDFPQVPQNTVIFHLILSHCSA